MLVGSFIRLVDPFTKKVVDEGIVRLHSDNVVAFSHMDDDSVAVVNWRKAGLKMNVIPPARRRAAA